MDGDYIHVSVSYFVIYGGVLPKHLHTAHLTSGYNTITDYLFSLSLFCFWNGIESIFRYTGCGPGCARYIRTVPFPLPFNNIAEPCRRQPYVI